MSRSIWLWVYVALCLGLLQRAGLAQAPGDAIAKFYIRTDKAATAEQVVAQASFFDLMLVSVVAHGAPLRARKPGLLLALYELPGGRFGGEEDFKAVSGHEEWFVHAASGQRIQQEENRLFLLDLGNPQYRMYEINHLVATMQAAKLDGVYLDVVTPYWLQQERGWVPSIPPAVIAAWPGHVLTFLSELRAALPAGKRLWWNSLPVREGLGRRWATWHQRALAITDGAQMDGFCYNRTHPYTPADFAFQLREIISVAAQGKTVLVKAAVKREGVSGQREGRVRQGSGGPEVQRIEEFCFAAYLLVADGKSTWYFPAHELNREVRSPIYQVRLGGPLGAFTRAGTLYQRDFARGLVLVNPTAQSASLPLGAPMVAASDGRSISTATLPPYSGLILRRP